MRLVVLINHYGGVPAALHPEASRHDLLPHRHAGALLGDVVAPRDGAVCPGLDARAAGYRVVCFGEQRLEAPERVHEGRLPEPRERLADLGVDECLPFATHELAARAHDADVLADARGTLRGVGTRERVLLVVNLLSCRDVLHMQREGAHRRPSFTRPPRDADARRVPLSVATAHPGVGVEAVSHADYLRAVDDAVRSSTCWRRRWTS